MAAMNGKIQKAGIPQNIRDHNARQLRSDFLASGFKTLCDMVRGVSLTLQARCGLTPKLR